MHGKGKYTDADGNQYEGDWVNGKKEGFGVMTFADDRPKQEGQWVQGVFKG